MIKFEKLGDDGLVKVIRDGAVSMILKVEDIIEIFSHITTDREGGVHKKRKTVQIHTVHNTTSEKWILDGTPTIEEAVEALEKYYKNNKPKPKEESKRTLELD